MLTAFWVDIVDLEAHRDELVAYYRDQTLNQLPEFAGLNPSIEHFARILCQELFSRLKDPLHADRPAKVGRMRSPGPPAGRSASCIGRSVSLRRKTSTGRIPSGIGLADLPNFSFARAASE